MKPHCTLPVPEPVRLILKAALVGAVAITGEAQIFIPDDSLVGVTSQITLSGLTAPVREVRVSMTIAAAPGEFMVNGDYYVLLRHGAEAAVLLNRVGRRPGASGGYADSGFDVTFADAAAADVHDYRLTLTGSHLIPLGAGEVPAGLTGFWQPDGRVEDPLLVSSGSPRTQTLSIFEGADPNGVWTLFIADVRSGGVGVLTGWNLEVTVVPEPEVWGFGVGIGLLVWAGWRGCRSRVVRS